jgi:hypothetical protein
MRRSNVVVEQTHVATGHLKGRGAVAEYPLRSEEVAAFARKALAKLCRKTCGEQRSAMSPC